MDLYLFISIAVIGSFGHCIGMCGGYVLSYSQIKINSNWTKIYQSFMHILYALGKATTYAFIGAIVGFIGQGISTTLYTRGIVFLVLGILMLFIGLSFLDNVKFLNFFKIDLLNKKIFKIIHKKVIASQTPISFYLFGLLNGMIPCGLVYFAASSALVTSSWMDGAFMMFLFGIAVIPGLFILGFASGYIKQKNRKILNYISVLLIMGYAVITIIKGLFLINGIKPM
jgi:sulfite exporter TauE/SafE